MLDDTDVNGRGTDTNMHNRAIMVLTDAFGLLSFQLLGRRGTQLNAAASAEKHKKAEKSSHFGRTRGINRKGVAWRTR